MSNINNVIISGRLVRDPELKQTGGGAAVCNFSIANSRTYMANGDKKQYTNFFPVQAWGKMGEIINQYCKKGQALTIQGRLQHRTWEKDGQKKEKIEIVLDSFEFGPKPQGKPQENGRTADPGPDPSFEDANPFDDSDVPF
jgi:single-strand DNA-binding protein